MKKVRAKGSLAYSIENIKRCYVDIQLEAKCPTCGAMLETSLGDDYLSYPVVGEDDWVGFYCDTCEDWYKAPIKVVDAELTIEYDPDDLVPDV